MTIATLFCALLKLLTKNKSMSLEIMVSNIVSIPKTKKVFSLEKWLKLDIGSSLRKTSLEQGWPMRCDGKTKEEEIVLSNWSYDQDVWDEVEVK